jgi:RNAse (barnase) inhibitor barstar
LILREVIIFLPSLWELLASNLDFPVSLIAVILALTLVQRVMFSLITVLARACFNYVEFSYFDNVSFVD